ncbi:MAG: hypothetical protein U5L96_08095 [Owenweeksia sp.]|nr:hypothetical protein [Owenweeksia sp.]
MGTGLLLAWMALRVYLNPEISVHTQDIITWFIALGVAAGIFWFLLRLRIKTAITKKGIEYKMTPFHNRKHLIIWDEISNIRVISIPRFASWQPAYNNYMLQRKFTFSGRNGISVETVDGDRIFIGSHKVKKLEKALNKARKHYGSH